MRHPHADVIIAFVNGEEVQRYDGYENKWLPYKLPATDNVGAVPRFDPIDQWRLAPKVPSKGQLLAAAMVQVDYNLPLVSKSDGWHDAVADKFINLIKENGYALS